jgi:predicted ATPase
MRGILMIESVSFKAVAESCLPWASSMAFFTKNPRVDFKPGLNVVFGKNGSGKSTLARLLALSLAAEQGGVSTATQSWMTTVCNRSKPELTLPCEVAHDGQPAMYLNARATPGLVGGSFDDDFFSEGLQRTLQKGSTGELGLTHLTRIIQVLNGKAPAEGSGHPLVASGFPSDIVWKVQRWGRECAHDQQIALLEGLLAPKCAVGPKTIILDEPDSGFSLAWQEGFWSNILATVDPAAFQIIVATHSPFALKLPNAHYIEMTPGIIAESETALSCLDYRGVQIANRQEAREAALKIAANVMVAASRSPLEDPAGEAALTMVIEELLKIDAQLRGATVA